MCRPNELGYAIRIFIETIVLASLQAFECRVSSKRGLGT